MDLPPSLLKLLDPIQNAALRIITGAFRTSPALSLCADVGIPPAYLPPPKINSKIRWPLPLSFPPSLKTNTCLKHPYQIQIPPTYALVSQKP